MPDHDPFATLGIPYGSTQEKIREAYHSLIKKSHPDLFLDAEKRKLAQEQTVKLNLAYEEALRLVQRKNVGFNTISCEEAKHFASRLLAQDNPEGALRQLGRAEVRDGEWHAIRGDILMRLKRHEEAHTAYREAVKRDPENRRFREGALQAALALKKSVKLTDKLFRWIKRRK